MNSSFRVLITGRTRLLIRFLGPINETADFEPVRFATKPPIEIDLGEATMINSLGIRGFKRWVTELKNEVIEFSHLPKFFVDQVNMIPNLVPMRTRVLSFYVPYYCEAKDLEKVVLYRSGLEFVREGGKLFLKHPTVTDDEHNTYEMDVMPERYFKFLESYT